MAQLTEGEKVLVESFCNDENNSSPDYASVTRLIEQIMFKAPMIRMSENHTMGGGKSYSYYFTPESSIPKMWCAHTIEISTVFNHPEETLVSGRRFDETFGKWPHCRNIFIGDRRLVFRELNTDEEPVAAHISRPPDSVGFLEGTHSRAGKRK